MSKGKVQQKEEGGSDNYEETFQRKKKKKKKEQYAKNLFNKPNKIQKINQELQLFYIVVIKRQVNLIFEQSTEKMLQSTDYETSSKNDNAVQ